MSAIAIRKRRPRPFLQRASLIVLLSFVCGSRAAQAYSQFTHQELIDIAWDDSIRPLLLQRYPGATEAVLTRARSYAYGGCLLQDVGYYPFGKKYFSNLTHYVRTGDFLKSLLRNAKSIDELAFAIGAISHYVGDSIGHSEAINPDTALIFPSLRDKYGGAVTYEESPIGHIRTEFGFDVAEAAWNQYPPPKYRKPTGFRFARPLLYESFREAYGIRTSGILGPARSALVSYRWSADFLVPLFLRAQIVLLRARLPVERPDTLEQQFLENIARSDYAREGFPLQPQTGIAAHLVALVIRITPRIGPLRIVGIKPPTGVTEEKFIKSFNDALVRFRDILAKIAAAEVPELPDLDLDTGSEARLGESALVDRTHAQLLLQIDKNGLRVPDDLRRYLTRFYLGRTPTESRDPRKRLETAFERLSQRNSD